MLGCEYGDSLAKPEEELLKKVCLFLFALFVVIPVLL
jgi:hypothetical protein